jgi:HEAT repeat protein
MNDATITKAITSVSIDNNAGSIRRRLGAVGGGSVDGGVVMGVGSDNNSQPATDPSDNSDASHRRRTAVTAGYRGNTSEAAALARDPDPSVRSAALGALARLHALDGDQWHAAARVDPAPSVRRRACELAGQWAARRGEPQGAPAKVYMLIDALDDDDASVVETAAWALGEFAHDAAVALGRLSMVATGHDDPLCREAAVASLGTLGEPGALPVVLAALEDKPAIRRRAAIALAAFDDPSATDGLRRCLDDRDWQVRQAAEDLLGP